MNKKILLPLLLLILCSITFHFIQRESDTPKLLQPFTSQDLSAYKVKMKKYQRQNGYQKSDKPQQFADILYRLKIKNNESEPAYTMGYKNRALQKAKSNLRKANVNTTNWIERGPNNAPGRTRTLVVDPRDNSNNTWIVGAVGGGIWKTTNKGATWQNLTDGEIPNLAISDIAISPSNHNIWYAGTGEGFFGTGAIKGNGLLKSTDGGNSWSFLSSTSENIDFATIYKIIVDPTNPNILVVTTSSDQHNTFKSGIFKSTDGGSSWNKVYTGNNYVQTVIHEPNNFNIQYATVLSHDILKSTDAGNTWSSIKTDLQLTGRIEIGVSPANTNIIYASVAKNGNSGKDGVLYVSRDKGDSWSLVSLNSNYAYLGGQGWYDHVVLPHPLDENKVYVCGVSIFKVTIDNTNDNGVLVDVTDAYNEYNGDGPNSAWDNHPFHPDQHSLQYINVNTIDATFTLIATNDGGVYYSGNSKTPGEANGDWTFAGLGLNTTQLYDIDKRKGKEQYFFGTQDNGTWLSGEGSNASKNTSYLQVIGGDGFASVWHSSDSSKLIGSYTNNAFYVSSNGGLSFHELDPSTSNLTDVKNNAPFISQLSSNKNAPDTLFTVGNSGVWKSTNFGKTWTLTPLNDGWISAFYMDLAVSQKDPLVLWAGSGMSNDENIQLSTDGGRSFKKTSNYLFNNTQMGPISGIATSPNDSSVAYLTFSYAGLPKIIKTTDFGKTWNDITGFDTPPSARISSSNRGFPDAAVYDILEFPNYPDTLWAATEIGVFETKDGGASWLKLDGNLPAVSIWELKIVDNQVLAATHGRGAWTFTISGNDNNGGDGDGEDTTLSSIEIPKLLDIKVLKSPITSNEKIRLDINNEITSHLDVEIISLSGKVVYQKNGDNLKIGKYTMTIPHPDLASGIYVLKLSYDNQVKSIKFVIE